MYALAVIGAAFWALFVSFILALIVFFVMVYVTRQDEVRERTDYQDNKYLEKTGNKIVTGKSALGSLAIAFVVFLLIFGVWALISSYTPIERGTVGLVTEFGGLTKQVLQPGLNWKKPFVQRVEVVDTTQQSYEMSSNPDTSGATWTDYPADSQTHDGQAVVITATTIFRIPNAEAAVDIRQNIGPVEEVVEQVVKANTRSLTRTLSKNYEAQTLYSGDVMQYQNAVREQLEQKFAEQGYGLVLVDFLLRDIDFDADYVNAVEQKQIAAENIITQANNAEAAKNEAKRDVELAKGRAQSEIEKAKGDAEARKLNADAEAYSIAERGEALKRYPQILQLEFVNSLSDAWGYLPSTAIEWLLPAPQGPTQ